MLVQLKLFITKHDMSLHHCEGVFVIIVVVLLLLPVNVFLS
jgi:hypothetical protein